MNEVEEFAEDLDKENDIIRRKKELGEKRLILDERKTEAALEKVIESDRSEIITKTANFTHMDADQIAAMVDESNTYMESARNGMEFISQDFGGVVPFYRKNLILIGGRTGEGKSTTVANIARNIISQTNPLTGELRRVLILTNEERASDLYNRITCCGRGWAYVNHDKFTLKQIEIMNESLSYMASKGIVTIIDDYFGGASGTTTTLEGMRDVFDNLIQNKIKYDAVIIDYYQNVDSSRVDIGADEYKIQERFGDLLDKVKNIYEAPIILLAQMKPPGDNDEAIFKHRLEGRKKICNQATFIMEMVRDPSRLRTEWIVHKSRYTAHNNKSFFTGFDRGRFVPYTQEFQAQVSRHMEERESEKLENLAGMRKDQNGEDVQKKASND